VKRDQELKRNQELKTVVLLLWELKIQKMKIMIPAVTTVNMEVKRLSMRVRRRRRRKKKKKKERVMEVWREVRYQISMTRRSLMKLNHCSK
jgi:predicted HAD superfamily hydrolase